MNKNLKVLYFSPTNSTKKIVQSIANSIASNYEELDMTLPQNRQQALSFSEDDLVIIGMPTYAGRIPKLLLSYLDQITAHHTLGVFIATYGNRAYEDILLEQYDLFTSKGFIGLGAAAFIAEHSYTNQVATNRPNMEDLKIASDFGHSISSRLKEIHTLSDLHPLSLPGERPYVVKKTPLPSMAPETDTTCTSCGICAQYCPAGAIDSIDFKNVDATQCIKCNCCIKSCPVHAKSFTHEAYENMKNMLITHFSHTLNTPDIFLA